MRRARLGLVIALGLASACQRGQAAAVEPHGSASGPEPEPAAGVVVPDLPIIAVSQRPIPVDAWAWSFDPSGRFIAAQFDDDRPSGCGVWDIESGLLVRAHDDPLTNPCSDWGRAHELAWEPSITSADGLLRAEVREHELEIAAVGEPGQPVVRACASCATLLAWAPVGHRLATSDGVRVDVWDGDTGELIRGEDLDLAGEVVESTLRWTAEGLVLAVVHRPGPDDPGYALSSFGWPTPGDVAKVQREVYLSPSPIEFYDDPSGRWLIVAGPEPRVIGTMTRSSPVGQIDAPEQSDRGPQYHGGAWRVDAATQWLEAYRDESRNEYMVFDLELGWRATVAEPNPGVAQGVVFSGRGFTVSGQVEPFAAASGVAVVRWEGCAAYEHGERCEADVLGWDARAGDRLVDVSPQLSLVLVERAGGLHLVEARGSGASFSALPYAVEASWRWGRGNWLAVLERSGTLGVVDLGSGRVVYTRDHVIRLPEVPLAVEHDLLAIEYADHLEIVNGSSGAGRIELAGADRRAALSPDGRRIASLDGRRIEVIELDSGAMISSFEVDAAFGLAWRQDGALLFYGDEWPTHAADPATGELLGALEHPALDFILPGEIDPSWRWIHHHDGHITRTLDFARIEIGATWARTDSGWFEGELADLPARVRGGRFRLGDDGDRVPFYTVDDLDRWLRRQGLVRGFFVGEHLPVPQIPADAAAKLAADR